MGRTKKLGVGEDAAPIGIPAEPSAEQPAEGIRSVTTSVVVIDGEEFVQAVDGETVTLIRL